MKAELNHIQIAYGKQVILKDISLMIESGKLCLLKGESGTGKTSLLKLLVTELTSYQGQYMIDGQDVKKMTLETVNCLKRYRIAYVSQEAYLPANFSLLENIQMIFDFTGRKAKKKDIKEWLVKFGLWKHRNKKIQKLSGGERQRAAILCVLFKDADLYVLDEPTAMLDSKNKELVIETIQSLLAQGKCVVAATHEEAFFENADIYQLEKQNIDKVREGSVISMKESNASSVQKKKKIPLLKMAFQYILATPLLSFGLIAGLSLCLASLVTQFAIGRETYAVLEKNIADYYSTELFVINKENDADYRIRYDSDCLLSIPEECIEEIKELPHIDSVEPVLYFPLAQHWITETGKIEHYDNMYDSNVQASMSITLLRDGQRVCSIPQMGERGYYGILPAYQHQNFDARCQTLDAQKSGIYMSKKLAEQLELSSLNGASINMTVMVPIASGTSLVTHLDSQGNLIEYLPALSAIYVRMNMNLEIRGILEDDIGAAYSDEAIASGIYMPIEDMVSLQQEIRTEWLDVIEKRNTAETDIDASQYYETRIPEKDYYPRSLIVTVDDIQNLNQVSEGIEALREGIVCVKTNLYQGFEFDADASQAYWISLTLYSAVLMIVMVAGVLLVRWFTDKFRRKDDSYFLLNGLHRRELYVLKVNEVILESLVISAVALILAYPRIANFNSTSMNTHAPFDVITMIYPLIFCVFIMVLSIFIGHFFNKKSR